MPVVHVPIDLAAREAYLDAYKAEAIAAVNTRVQDVMRTNYPDNAFIETVYQHRAVQAFAYLADPDGDAHIARYPLIPSGIPSYGATRAEVAESYIAFNNQVSADLVALYEDRRHVVNELIPAQTDKPQIDTLRDAFLASHPIWA